eukprot:TRINITY_DN50646_c0_g1_i1.p1 TRINITY_DN50646_c0_g1~~TRINITY_DN50646_c0_g1_i1.p1  ORF type:complete len:115 (-),score=32.98 TRINITY_DN50646_c0_g1_i1:616-960(-)
MSNSKIPNGRSQEKWEKIAVPCTAYSMTDASKPRAHDAEEDGGLLSNHKTKSSYKGSSSAVGPVPSYKHEVLVEEGDEDDDSDDKGNEVALHMSAYLTKKENPRLPDGIESDKQ